MGRACLSVRAFDCVGMENSLDGTDSGRARGTVDCASVVRAFDCLSVGAHGTVDCLSVRLRVRLRLRLRACDCDCTTRGHGKHGHGKGTAPQMGRARVLGTNWTLSALQHWFESSLLTSNKAVRVVGVHSSRLNSYPSW